MKKLIKGILDGSGIIIRKKKPWMNNYKWLQELGINTILDIGANEGQFVKEIRSLFPNALIYSFEPIKGVYEKLTKNLSEDKNIKFFNVGLGDSESVLEMNVSDHSPSSSLLDMEKTHIEKYPHSAKTHKESITVKTLDGVLTAADIRQNLLIKVDVQGYEDKVIKGGTEIFSMAKVAIIETTYKSLFKNQKLFEDIYDLMVSLGFKYRGNYKELRYSNQTGEVLFGDSIFIRE
jgi:FkbM family methyltransferase